MNPNSKEIKELLQEAKKKLMEVGGIDEIRDSDKPEPKVVELPDEPENKYKRMVIEDDDE